MVLFVETSNDLKMYGTTEILTTPTSYSGETVTIGKNFFLNRELMLENTCTGLF